LERFQSLLDDQVFLAQQRRSEADFTRIRILTFKVVVLLLLAKTTKSLQLTLNEIVPRLASVTTTVSNAAYSKARAKLRHTAFIEFNRLCVVETMYSDDDDCSLIEFLHALHEQLGEGEKVTLIWDGLPSHRSKFMKEWIRTQRHWLVVEQLPGYAHDLNPTEQVWQMQREPT
jgi:hypothetical protein